MSKASDWVIRLGQAEKSRPKPFKSRGVCASVEKSGKVWISFDGDYKDDDLEGLGKWLVETFGPERKEESRMK